MVWMDQSPPRFGAETGERGGLAACLGLGERDLAPMRTRGLPPPAPLPAGPRGSPRGGRPGRARPGAAESALRRAGAEGCYLLAEIRWTPPAPSPTRSSSTRPSASRGPTTGTAAGPLAARSSPRAGSPTSPRSSSGRATHWGRQQDRRVGFTAARSRQQLWPSRHRRVTEWVAGKISRLTRPQRYQLARLMLPPLQMMTTLRPANAGGYLRPPRGRPRQPARRGSRLLDHRPHRGPQRVLRPPARSHPAAHAGLCGSSNAVLMASPSANVLVVFREGARPPGRTRPEPPRTARRLPRPTSALPWPPRRPPPPRSAADRDHDHVGLRPRLEDLQGLGGHARDEAGSFPEWMYRSRAGRPPVRSARGPRRSPARERPPRRPAPASTPP